MASATRKWLIPRAFYPAQRPVSEQLRWRRRHLKSSYLDAIQSEIPRSQSSETVEQTNIKADGGPQIKSEDQ